MKIFWSFKSIPELAEMPKSEAKKIWLRCYLKSYRSWQAWLALIICGACAAFGYIIGYTISDTYIVGPIGAGIGGAIGGLIGGHIHTRRMRQYICEYLKSHNHVCYE